MNRELTEASVMFAGGTRRRGRPTLFGTPATRKIEIMVTDEQWRSLDAMSRSEHRRKTDIAREAINTYVADYGERAVFRRGRPYSPE